MSAPKLGPSPSQITLMGRNITARIEAAARRRRRRARIAVAGGATAVALSLTAAGLLVAVAPQQVRESTYACYAADDVRADWMAVTLFDDLGELVIGGSAQDAIDLCAVQFGNSGVATPDPTACELPDLRLAVFPNVERVADHVAFCLALGLGAPPE